MTKRKRPARHTEFWVMDACWDLHVGSKHRTLKGAQREARRIYRYARVRFGDDAVRCPIMRVVQVGP